MWWRKEKTNHMPRTERQDKSKAKRRTHELHPECWHLLKTEQFGRLRTLLAQKQKEKEYVETEPQLEDVLLVWFHVRLAFFVSYRSPHDNCSLWTQWWCENDSSTNEDPTQHLDSTNGNAIEDDSSGSISCFPQQGFFLWSKTLLRLRRRARQMKVLPNNHGTPRKN